MSVNQGTEQTSNVGAAVLALLVGLGVCAAVSAMLMTSLAFFAVLVGSLAGAALAAAIYPSWSLPVVVLYIIPGTLVLIGLPIIAAAMSDGHPPNVAALELLPVANVVLCLAIFALVPRIPSSTARFAMPLLLAVAGGAAAVTKVRLEREHQAHLFQQTNAFAGRAFELEMLPRLIAAKPALNWHTSGANPINLAARFPGGDLTLSSQYAYTLPIHLTLETKSDFTFRDPRKPGVDLERAKAWLIEEGVAKSLTDTLEVDRADVWGSRIPENNSPINIFPKKGHIVIDGLLEYNPAKRSFLF